MNKKLVDVRDIDLDKLKKRMGHGFGPKLVERTGYSIQYIYFVLSPKDDRMNKEIIQAAIQLAEEGEPPIEVEVNEELEKELVA